VVRSYVFEGGIRVPAIVQWPAGLDGGELERWFESVERNRARAETR
jgi:arylsulfatase A-like enzyme